MFLEAAPQETYELKSEQPQIMYMELIELRAIDNIRISFDGKNTH